MLLRQTGNSAKLSKEPSSQIRTALAAKPIPFNLSLSPLDNLSLSLSLSLALQRFLLQMQILLICTAVFFWFRSSSFFKDLSQYCFSLILLLLCWVVQYT
jgi:hypothetical protein